MFHWEGDRGMWAGSQEAEDGVVLLIKQFSTLKGNLLVRSDSWYKKENKSNRTHKRSAKAFGGKFYSSPWHCTPVPWNETLRWAALLSPTKWCPGPADHRTQILLGRVLSPLWVCVPTRNKCWALLLAAHRDGRCSSHPSIRRPRWTSSNINHCQNTKTKKKTLLKNIGSMSFKVYKGIAPLDSKPFKTSRG